MMEWNRQLDDHSYKLEPIIGLSDSTTLGHELLCRANPWPTAEEEWAGWYRRIVPTCNEIARAGNTVFLNVDTRHVTDSQIFEALSDLSGNRVVLEWTEHPEGDHGMASAALRMLRERCGIRIAIDDFGAGEDGVGRILRTRPDFVKLDKFITKFAQGHENHLGAVKAMIPMIVSSGAAIIAEHIETEADLGIAREIGAHYGQGFYWGKGRLCNGGKSLQE